MREDRRFEIKTFSDPERHFYSVTLTENNQILAQTSGIDESTVLHMFVTLAGNVFSNNKHQASLNERLSVLERFAHEIVFKREY